MLHISIPKPCHEDWNKMSPRGQGAFCSVCSKTVVDFTFLSDEQVKNYFLSNAGQKTCGRFRKEQLSDDVNYLPQLLSGNIPLWKKFLAAVVILFAGLLTSCNESATKGQIHIEENKHQVPDEPLPVIKITEPPLPDSTSEISLSLPIICEGVPDTFISPPILGDVEVGAVETVTGTPVVIEPDMPLLQPPVHSLAICTIDIPSKKDKPDSIKIPVRKECEPGKDSLTYLKPG